MSVFKRKTTKGKTEEYHYKFMQGGKTYYGVCEGCTTIETAREFEQGKREIAKNLASQKNVKALVENFRDELSGGEKIRLRDAFELSLKKPRRRSANDRQVALKSSRFNDFVAFMSEKYPDISYLSQVQKKHAEEYITLLRTNGCFDKTVRFKNHLKGNEESEYKSKRKKLAPGTINAYHKVIKEVFFALSDDAGIYKNHFAGIQMMSDKIEPREAFTEEELELIIKKADSFIKPIFILGFFTALREGDISTLRWREINYETHIIRRKLLKTGATVEIPIMPPLMEFLQEQYKLTGDSEYILPEHAKMYLDNPSGISYRVKKFLEGDLKIKTTKKVKGRDRAVSIKDVHSLRHTFCYFAGVAGIPLVVVQSIVGHMTPEMTAHYTAHADRKTKREKMLLLPNLVKSLPRPQEIGETSEVEGKRKHLLEHIALADADELKRFYSLLAT